MQTCNCRWLTIDRNKVAVDNRAATLQPGPASLAAVLHSRRGDWHFTALFSNTTRTNELKRTRDWVVIHFYDSEHVEGSVPWSPSSAAACPDNAWCEAAGRFASRTTASAEPATSQDAIASCGYDAMNDPVSSTPSRNAEIAMQLPLQIAFRELAPSEALENLIRKKAKKLDQFHSRIMSCHVVVEKLPKHHRHGREFQIHIDVRVPGAEEIVSTLQHHEDVYVALRDAFDSVARQIEDVIRQQRGDVKTHETPQYGAIVRLLPADGCGFIEATDGRQIYFSRENVVQPPFEHLRIGMHVRFLAEPADEGWQAKRVSVGKHGDVDTALAEGAQ